MNLDERLRNAADRLNADLQQVPLPAGPHRARTPWQAVAVTALVTIVAVGSVAVLLGPGSDDDVVTTRQTTTTAATSTTAAAVPLLGDPTEVVLLFDDGIDGVLAVDPDGRRAARSVVAGQLAGDQDPRLHRTGDHLVVGWGEITAVDVVTREQVALGEATIFLPAVEVGRVWLVDWEGGRIGQGEATAWQVVVATGKALTEPMRLPAAYPKTGIAGGLALQTDDGVALWANGEVFRRLGEGDGAGRVLDIHRNRIAWCSAECDTLHVTDLYGGDRVITGADPSLARFSPDGRLLAFTDGPWVQVLDVQAETLDQAGRLTDSEAGYIGWSADGRQLFASTYAYGEQTMELLRYRLADQRLDQSTLPFGGALDFIVIDEDEATLYFDSALEESCTPSGAAPSRQGICTFEF